MQLDLKALGDEIADLIADAVQPLQREISLLRDEVKELREREPAKGEDGKSVELAEVMQPIAEQVRTEVAKVVADIPAPKDGASVDPEDVRKMVAEEVAKLPSALPGKDAEPVDVDAIADTVVAKLLGTDRIRTLVNAEAVDAVASHFEAHPVHHGEDGDSVTDEDLQRAVRMYLQANPPEPGKSVTIEDISLFLDAAVIRHVLDLERRANDAIARAIEKIPVPKDGLDGLSMADVARTYDADAHEVIERWTIAGEANELRYPAGGIRPGGFWREGMKCHALQLTTHDGALWLAKRDTTARPCLENQDDWQLAARKGRDGRDGKDGKPPPGPVKLGSGDGA